MTLYRAFPIAVICAAGLVLAQDRGRGHQKQGDRKIEFPPLVRKAIEAAPRLSYAGERDIQFRRGPNLVRHRENVIKNGPRFRIEFSGESDFAGQIIIETPEFRQHYFPDKNEIFMTPPRGDGALLRSMRPPGAFGKRHVQFREGELAVVAGKQTTPVSMVDEKGNPMMRLYIDPRNGMILKREFFDPVGTVVGLHEYTSIDYTPNFRGDEFKPMKIRGARIVTPLDVAKKLMRENGLLEVFLPADFGLRLENARLVPGDGKPTLLLFYQSQRGHVSFYQVTGNLDPKKLRREARGEFRTTNWSDRGKTFVIVGELSDPELAQLSRKVRGN